VRYANFLPLLAFAITAITVWWLARHGAARFAIDRPNERSLHDKPVPRTGGVGVHSSILLLCPFVTDGIPAAFWIIFLCLTVVSFVDDLRGLPVAARLSVHLIGSGMFASVAIHPDYGPIAAGVIAIGVTWAINLYNFMDGSDGLAGGMALFGFSSYGFATWLAGNTELTVLNFTVAAAAMAFLLFNFHPARIFMGDVGAVPLGFLAATIGILGWQQQVWTWWFPLLVFSPFIADATITLARRALAGARVWEAHRDHYYQRLVRMGWGHRGTALLEYALMALCGSMAIAGLHWPQPLQAGLLAAAAVLYAAVAVLVGLAWRRYLAGHANET